MFNNVLSVVQIFLEKMVGFIKRNLIKGERINILFSLPDFNGPHQFNGTFL